MGRCVLWAGKYSILFLGTLVYTQVNKFSKAVGLPKPTNNFTEVALD